MLIQLLDYSIENEGSTNAWANISIKRVFVKVC